MVSNSEKNKYAIDGIALVLATLILLAVFCYFSGLPMIIPVLVFLLGLHLYITGIFTSKRFLHLGLLLAILMFCAHVLKSYATISNFYLPVAVVPMLVMLLFNNTHLTFVMAFLASALTGLMLGFDLTEFVIFFIGGIVGAYKVNQARTRGAV